MIKDTIDAFLVQYRVIMALIFREINTRYGRENIGFLWIIGEPILFCAGVTIVWSLIRASHEHGIPMPAFVITGYMPLTMWRHCVGRGVKAFESNGSLLYHRHVSPLDILTARCILEILGTLMAGFIVILGCIALGYMAAPVDPDLLYAGLLYHVVFCFASALIVASLSEVSDMVEKSIQIVMYLSIPFSGCFVMVDWLPTAFQNAVLWSPSVHNEEMIRGGQFGPGVHPHYSFSYDTWSTALLLLIGLSLTMRVRRHLIIH